MAIIYRKTAKGMAEIETRAHRLPPRMRSALILVDGKRSDDALAALIQAQAIEMLHALAGQGFIEVLSVAAPPVSSVPDLQARRRDAVRAVNDLPGPAGEFAAVRLERARHVAELRVALSAAVQTVSAARGRQAGEAFATRFCDI